ncbi:bacteriochlorophyll 4-vinyl reductase [Gymnodinialimonas sp. 2305UL16-5]|uniref:bacteriochlorophyll 4-vinyl reductase n=1 Tax=Gymnodinialimonas mytili TaxID=3126503 RepID=UPI00309A38A2
MLDTHTIPRIGPNALIQTEQALLERLGSATTAVIFAEAGLQRGNPGAMVPQTEVRVLFDALMTERPRDWPEIAEDAGARTADYILANRIPGMIQGLLKALPAALAGPILARAIARHAWTFAGSGTFSATRQPELTLTIAHNPIAIPGCPWHCAVFTRLFQTLATPRCTVRHTACCAKGDPNCIFQIKY